MLLDEEGGNSRGKKVKMALQNFSDVANVRDVLDDTGNPNSIPIRLSFYLSIA